MEQKCQEMSNIRTQIVSYFQKLYQDTDITEYTLFGSYSGNRLSEYGNKLMMKEFNHHVYPLEAEISLYKKTMLNENMPRPYFLSDKKIILYDDNDASSLLLIGDVSLWVESLIM